MDSVSILALSSPSSPLSSWVILITSYLSSILHDGKLVVYNQDNTLVEGQSTEKVEHLKDMLEKLEASAGNIMLMYVDGVIRVGSTGSEHWKIGTSEGTTMAYNFAGDLAAFNLTITGITQ